VTNKLYVAGVSWDTTNDGLFNYFSRFGTVVSAQVQRDHVSGRSRGFGFVTFADRTSCEKVLAENLSLDGRKMEIKYAIPKGQVASYDDSSRTAVGPGGRPKKIYIAGISVGVTEEDLKEHFATFGRIVECYIQKDRNTGESRGFAFLTFENPDSVDKVLQKPSQKIGDKCIVDVKIARPKGEAPGWSSFSDVGSGASSSSGPPSWGGYSSGGFGATAPGYAPTGYSSWSGGLDTIGQLGSTRVADGYGGSTGRDYSYSQYGYDQGYGTGVGGTGAGSVGGYGDQSGLGGYGQWQGASASGDDGKRGYDSTYGAGYGTTGTASYDPTGYSYGTTGSTSAYDPTNQYTYGALRRTAPTTTTPTTASGTAGATTTAAARRTPAYHPYSR
jgi:heterogeneous nuclear ribonucleoprotein A1/A3